MAYINEDGELVLEPSDGSVPEEEEQRDENGCLPLDPSQPYRSLCFLPSEEPCVIPSIIRQKGRRRSRSYLFRSERVSERPYFSMTWEYYNGTSYVTTTSLNNMTITSTSATNRPRVRFDIYDADNVLQETLYSPHYRQVITDTTVTPPVTTTTYVNALAIANPVLNQSNYIDLPNNDAVDNDYVRNTNATNLTASISKVRLFYFVPVDGTFVISEFDDPTAIRTGPDETLAYISQSEENNDNGVLEAIDQKVRYNYVTEEFENV